MSKTQQNNSNNKEQVGARAIGAAKATPSANLNNHIVYFISSFFFSLINFYN